MAYVVALSGGVASGKSTVADLFAKLRIPIIDADIIARQIITSSSSVLSEIVKHFSQEILLSNGELDRAQLREIIFNNDHERLWLNNLLHPLIQQETQKQIKKQVAPYTLWVVPLLIENNLQGFADSVLIIDIDAQLQRQRLISRDKINADLAQKMVLSQVSNVKRLSFADKIIKNSGDLVDLTHQVAALHDYYLIQTAVKDKHE